MVFSFKWNCVAYLLSNFYALWTEKNSLSENVYVTDTHTTSTLLFLCEWLLYILMNKLPHPLWQLSAGKHYQTIVNGDYQKVNQTPKWANRFLNRKNFSALHFPSINWSSGKMLSIYALLKVKFLWRGNYRQSYTKPETNPLKN